MSSEPDGINPTTNCVGNQTVRGQYLAIEIWRDGTARVMIFDEESADDKADEWIESDAKDAVKLEGMR